MRFRPAVILLALFCSTIALAAPAADPKPKQAASLPAGVKVERDIRYVPDGDPSESLDLYLPENSGSKPLPVVVWVHGGGWHGGSKAGCPAVGFISHGYAAASVEYRFSQKAIFPAQIQDCQAAIRWLRANSKKYNLDPNHIGVWGASAGGHLVALLGTAGGKNAFAPVGGNEDQSDRVQAVCDWFGPADFSTVMAQAAEDKVKNIFKFNSPTDPYSSLIGASLEQSKEKDEAVSPVHYVSKDNPPILIMHGTSDALVPFAQSVEFADALTKAGVDVTLQKFPGAGHGGPAFSRAPVTHLIETFFDKHLMGKDVEIKPLPDSVVSATTMPSK
jgi:acetyl esterase/lipase